MKYTVGFIGVGNMGGALLKAVLETVSSDKIAIYDANPVLSAQKAKDCGVNYCELSELVKNSKYIFVGVKPNVLPNVVEQIKNSISKESVIVSMAAGVSIAQISGFSDTDNIIRIMPNTPVTVGKGMILYCLGRGVCDKDELDFLNLMSFSGTLDKLDEKLIDAAAALSGCGPAFVYMFIDALADGAVKCGLPRDKALDYAKQTVYGSAFYSMNSEKHPDKLKDEVCSPGGTTIEGVLALEKGAFRHTTSSAVVAAFEKTKLL